MEKIISLFITMTMMITPTVKPSTPTLEPTDATVEPMIEPSTPTVAPTPTADIPIKYDDTAERKAHYARNFHITAAEKNSDGNYVIDYTLETFLEGRGAVSVSFRCLDAGGKVVDSFGGLFVGTDYTWSTHKSSAVISNKTVRIELVLN